MTRLEKWEPGRNEPCICGSGRKFKKCCMSDYSSDASRRATEKFNQGLYEDALTCCRRHITWYVLCHKAHTVPFLKSGDPKALWLLSIDIEALADIVDLLYLCHHYSGRSAQFCNAIEQLAGAIADPRWDAKVRYFRALWFLCDANDRDGAFEAISGIDIRSCIDPEILMLYIDVCPKALPFSEKLDILERVLKHTKKASELLQYTLLKGISYCLISEVDEGCRIIASGIRTYRAADRQERSDYGECFLAHALLSLGKFDGQDEHIREAAGIYAEQLKLSQERSYVNAHAAMLARQLGDCYRCMEQYDLATHHYRQSLAYEKSPVTLIFLAQCYANMDNVDPARDLLSEVSVAGLDDAARYDYAVCWTMLAVRSQKPSDIELARVLLEKVTPQEPLLVHQRDKCLITLLNTKPKPDASLIRKMIRLINRYVTVNPNIFGIGLNVNRIVEDINPEAKKNDQGEGQPSIEEERNR
jgi:tetratricopeptide (TPR) repeat protein